MCIEPFMCEPFSWDVSRHVYGSVYRPVHSAGPCLCIDMRIDMCKDMCTGMCIDMLLVCSSPVLSIKIHIAVIKKRISGMADAFAIDVLVRIRTALHEPCEGV